MGGAISDLTVEAFLGHMAAGQVEQAVELALAQLDDDHSPADLIRGLLAPAQAEVGELWYRSDWPNATEHVATAVADAVLYRLAAIGSPSSPGPVFGRLAVACAPGDWHTFPCRMAGELLRLFGWQVQFLGASLPSWHLGRWIARERPDGVVLTSTAPAGLRGILTVAGAAGEVGVPVVAGGVGLGPDGRRASALGVRWCSSLEQIGDVLAAAAPAVDPADLADRVKEHDLIALSRADFVQLPAAAAASIDSNVGSITDLAEEVGHLVDVLAACVLADDRRILSDYLTWWQGYRKLRGLDGDVVGTSLTALAGGVPDGLPRTRALLAAFC